MKLQKMQRLVASALFAAIICVATFIVKIPSPSTGGYFNLGDCFVILSGMLLNPFYGALASGIGSALADLLSGYIQYVPATFVIKALMSLTVYFVIKTFKGHHAAASRLCSGIAAETLMVLGYFGYEAVFLGYGIAAAGSVLSNISQGIFGICAALAIYFAISKNKSLSDFFRKG